MHAYRPVEHALARVGPAPSGETSALVVTGVPWRTGWRYRERGYRHIFWDAGTMLSQQLALAASAGIPARLYTEFPDLAIRDLVGADGIAELPVAVVALGDGAPGWTPAERGARGIARRAAGAVPARHRDALGRDQPRWGEPWRPGEADGPLPDTPSVDETIYRRGSTRLMDPSRGVPQGVLDASLARRAAGHRRPPLRRRPRRRRRRAGPLPLARPRSAGSLPASLRAELRRIALGQGLAGDAAFVVIGAADLALDLRSRAIASSSSPPGSSRDGCTSPPTRSATAPRA